ncbi:transmembrane protein, putative [Rhizoctonia solani AG-3 Rhs1AP]|uniref:Transmembrane protein, putative n=2 Tax=Rhizoctonia solani AG-3 TaxID=1086053 RepID=A0A0A1UL81_9AGAM|nr:transmembrane protein, putative [Rhizoctonia solani AG-3 Rhs1AP]KEP47336.1 putative transmembrane protein [Rhizoctonia solani 123E]
MSTFSRIAVVVVFLFSVGLLVSALPSPRAADASWAIVGADMFPVCTLLEKFFLEVKVCIDAIAACHDLVTLKLKVAVFVALCKGCAADLLKIGADVKITAEAQASIVNCFVSMLTLLVQVCVNLTAKFGVAVIATLCAEIDIVLKFLFVHLDICINGVLGLIAKAYVNTSSLAF